MQLQDRPYPHGGSKDLVLRHDPFSLLHLYGILRRIDAEGRDPPALVPEEAQRGLNQCGHSGPVATDQADHLSGIQSEAHSVKHFDAVVVELMDVLEFEGSHLSSRIQITWD